MPEIKIVPPDFHTLHRYNEIRCLESEEKKFGLNSRTLLCGACLV